MSAHSVITKATTYTETSLNERPRPRTYKAVPMQQMRIALYAHHDPSKLGDNAKIHPGYGCAERIELFATKQCS